MDWFYILINLNGRPRVAGGRQPPGVDELDGGETGMLAFFLGITLGALGGLMFLVLLAEVVRKDEMAELSDPHD